MTNTEQRRLTNWRLKLLQAATSAGNVARTCRHFGISRKTFYKWRQRHREHGDAGLADRARAPRHSPRATSADVVSKILYLRQHYHFEPGKIAAYLKRFHGVSVACASVQRILQRHGMNRLPANHKYRRHAHRWTRYEKAQRGIVCRSTSNVSSGFRARARGSINSPRSMTARGFACSRFTMCATKGRQRRRVPIALPLAPRGLGYPPRVHPTSDAASERQSRALAPRR